ncbi:MAG: type II secretion system minor pseudopilin GspH [Gammaproteobacteria bacterium]|nr:type II secretion system minor pseudopilin GspH [Gammaproteobacteria bacterium]
MNGPARVTGSWRSRRQPRSRCGRSSRAFTLLEVLVVLFVVAIMAGIAVMQIGSRDRDRHLQTEARRLQHALELTRNEAVLSASEWGLQFTSEGYRFLRLDLDSGRWELVESPPWREHAMRPGIDARLRIEDRRRGPDALGASGNGTGSRRPGMLILSSGEMTPFRIDLLPEWSGAGWRLSSDGFSGVSAERLPP